MQHIDGVCEPNRVDSSVRTALIVVDDLDNTCATEATQGLRSGVHIAQLGEIERIAEDVLDIYGKLPKIVARRPHKIERPQFHREESMPSLAWPDRATSSGGSCFARARTALPSPQ